MGCWGTRGINRSINGYDPIHSIDSPREIPPNNNSEHNPNPNPVNPNSYYISPNIDDEEEKIDPPVHKAGKTSSKHQLLASENIHLPNISSPEELYKIKTTTDPKLTPELKNEVFGKGTNGFKEHYENPEIDSDVMNTAVTVV